MSALAASWAGRCWPGSARSSPTTAGTPAQQDVDDAALAAGRYLCATGSMGSDAGWRAGMLAYNDSSAYLTEVAAWAGAYGRASLGG